MGYYANGSGSVMPKSEVPEDVLALLSSEFSEVADSPDGGLWLTFEFDNYHDDKMIGAMQKLAPYVKYGNVSFRGEYDHHWRFHFENEKMYEQEGKIVYE